MEETGRDRKGVQEDTRDRAVSEVVSIVLLLAVVVAGVGLIAVTIYSQPTPGETPQVEILVSESSSTVCLTHNGGDALAEGTFYVLADGMRLGSPVSPPGGAWPWSIGEVLQYAVPSAPGQVQVVYDGGGGAVLLKSATFSGAGGTTGPDVPAEPTGGGGTYVSPSFDSQDELDAWVVDQFVEQLEGNSIYLSQNIKSQNDVWGSSGFFNFTLSDGNSYLELAVNNVNEDPSRIAFALGDVMSIRLADSEMRFFAIGHGGWHIFATGVTVYKNGQPLSSGGKQYAYVTGGRIYGYSNFTSSVTVMTDPNKDLQTEFYINNTPIIKGTWNKRITLTEIKPADPTLMILDISKNDPNYYIGTAESITGYT